MCCDACTATLQRIRWHAEIGANSFDTLPERQAAENAEWRLNAIVRALDRLEDTLRLTGIFGVVGVKPR